MQRMIFYFLQGQNFIVCLESRNVHNHKKKDF